MTEKMPVNVDLRNVQETVEDGSKRVREFGRKAALAYVGAWGLAYDAAKEMMQDGESLFDKAAKRGEEIEQMWLKNFEKIQDNKEVKRVVDYVEDQVDVVMKNTESVRKNAEGIVNEVEKFLDQVNPMKGETVAENVEIVVEAIVEPFAGYMDMSAKELIGKLPEMPMEELKSMRAYEVANKNRVTVLREIDALLEAAEKPVEAVAA